MGAKLEHLRTGLKKQRVSADRKPQSFEGEAAGAQSIDWISKTGVSVFGADGGALSFSVDSCFSPGR